MSDTQRRFDTPGFEWGLVVAVALVVGVGAWLTLGNGEDGDPEPPVDEGLPPVEVTADELPALAEELGDPPLHWVGPEQDHLYEVRRTPSDHVFVRYVPEGEADVADGEALTVAVYPQAEALAAIRESAEQEGAELREIPGGGEAVVNTQQPTSVHLTYPDAGYQIEVYDPSPGRALELVEAGRVERVR